MSADRHHPPRKFQPRAPIGYDAGMEARVAVLEQIARDTRDVLMRLETKMDAGFARLDSKADALDFKIDSKTDGIRDKQERDFRLVAGMLIVAVIGLAGVMAHGFKWIP